MRAAPPPVELSLGTGRRERAAVALLYSLAASTLAVWLVQRPGGGTLDGLGQVGLSGLVLAITVTAGLLGWSVLRPLQGDLRWDGASWWHVPAEGARAAQPLRTVHLQLDFGGWVLLRMLRKDRSVASWCGVTAAEAGPAWHCLRLALYHRPAQPGLP